VTHVEGRTESVQITGRIKVSTTCPALLYYAAKKKGIPLSLGLARGLRQLLNTETEGENSAHAKKIERMATIITSLNRRIFELEERQSECTTSLKAQR